MNNFTISCPIVGYHVTTKKKLQRYMETGCILAPVRFWPNKELAQNWCKRVGREIILEIDLNNQISHPLPDHKPAMFTPDNVSNWKLDS